jgi:hypothetical protein
MNLSPKVSLLSATKSDTAIRWGIDNTPDQVQLENMMRVSGKIIEPILSRFPTAFISSFFRSAALNRKIGGGAKKSQHMTGEAVDLDSPDNLANLDIFLTLYDMVFDQLILEYPNEKGIPSWVHVSLKDRDNRGQVLVKLKDKYIPYGEFQIGMI